MEQQPSAFNDLFELRIDEEAQALLLSSAKWAKVIAIFGFIAVGLGFVAPFFTVVRADAEPAARGLMIGSSLFGALIFGIVSILLNTFMYRFAIHTSDGLSTMNQDTFNKGTNNLRFYFKTLGIILIVLLSLFVLLIFFAMIAALLTASIAASSAS